MRYFSKAMLVASAALCLNLSAYSQDISLKINNVTVKEAMERVKKYTGYSFVFSSKDVNTSKRISVSVSDASIEEVIKQILKGQQGLDYEIQGKKIVLRKAQPVVKQVKSEDNKVIGKITDNNGEPIIGATILEKGTTNGTVSDFDGNFSLNVSRNGELEISYVGYQTQTIKATSGKLLSVKMKEDSELLEEVVVVGYGVQKKVNLTGAVSSIDYASQVDKRPIINVGTSLAGMSAGLQVTQGSGRPGDDNATIRVRGNTSLNSNAPLVIVDGMECDLGSLNPNDIASISVLKDAGSTAIYGSRAANGVILVTTKNGSEEKTTVNYSFSGIVQKAYTNIETVNDYSRYMSLVNEACDNIGTNRIFSDYNIEKWAEAAQNPYGLADNGLPNYMVYPNTNWFDELFSTGFSQEHNLSISGGSKKVRYLVSAGYLDNRGVISAYGVNSGIKKMNFRANVEADPFNWLKVGTRIFGQYKDKGMANIDNAFKYLYITTPGIFVGEPDKWGMIANEAEESIGANNIMRSMYGSDGYDKNYNINGTFYGAITPFKGLSIEAKANMVAGFGYKSSYGRPNGDWNYNTNEAHSTTSLENAKITNSTNKSLTVNTELLARYNTDFNNSDHDLGILFGYTTTHYESSNFNVQKQGATDWTLNELSTYELLINSGSGFGEWALRSYFGRANYVFKDRYLFEANLRIDGSSRFAKESRYGYFPSLSAGWRISEEKFMKKFSNLSNLKIRASWGQMGNNASGNYDWQALYSPVNVVIGGNPVKGIAQTTLSNSLLQWERTTTTNLGIDFGLWGNKLSGSLDVYNKYTDGILYKPSLYLTMGTIGASTQNLAEIRNRGIEFSLTYNDKIGEDFSFSVTTNWGFNKNKVMKFKGKLEEYWTYDKDGNKDQYFTNKGEVTQGGFGGLICEGHELGETSMRFPYNGTGAGYSGEGTVDPNAGPKDGMIRTEADMEWVKAMMDAGYKFNGKNSVGKDKLWYGDLIYQDINGDGNYGDGNDFAFTGHSNIPAVNAGLNASFEWKGIDFSMLWVAALGFHLNWNNVWNRSIASHGQALALHVADDHYFYDPDKPDDPRTNINGKYPRYTFGTGYDNTITSTWYEYRGDYLKLKNIQLGYSLPKRYINKILLSKLRLFVSMDNILTITNYPGQDPEAGVDIKYPLMTQVTFGLQASF